MYIRKIKIQNYRNFSDFSMEFRKGLNVIIGSNNSGKTGLLYAIRLLSDPTRISIHDFNKNNLSAYSSKYLKEPPKIEIEYEISHEISEDDTEDESIIKLVPFLGMKNMEDARQEENGNSIYNLTACVKMTFSLESKATADYLKAINDVDSLDGYISTLETFLDRYTWKFTNSVSKTEADKKEATGIFDIRFIEAERTSENVYKETKREIDAFAKDQNNTLKIQDLKNKLAEDMKGLFEPALTRMSTLFENENNEIGLHRGNVSIYQNMRPTVSIADAYVTDVRDTKGDFVVPLNYNGLGYNNLINIYMLIKLTEIRKGKDFRILCLEEPEAHLHPAMQYKLFKFLSELDEDDKLNQQIFVTTHSSNISAVAGIDNMFMLDYSRNDCGSDCCQQSLASHFEDKDEKKNEYKQIAKNHLTKFLDVTRSDMLFADKVILVEGIAEKLLLPMFMEKVGGSYEDGHISIVEIGGKHFEHFIELFNGNAVRKKVLCITDRDFKWIKESGGVRTLSDYKSYNGTETPHIKKLIERFPIDNLHIITQTEGGRTFEDELFLANILDCVTAEKLMRLVATETISGLLDAYKLSFNDWDSNRPSAANSIVSMHLDVFKAAISKDAERKDDYMRLFFAELFLHYACNRKGDIALNILTNDELSKTLVVPKYIKEGLEWLSK
ncbi:MAG: AAA family ATPase [Clostridiales bacterium]|jgi:predicted ATP-dependent endonuclease of OLD family|nr:AAA family ATPase [Clostridiales bacterium]